MSNITTLHCDKPSDICVDGERVRAKHRHPRALWKDEDDEVCRERGKAGNFMTTTTRSLDHTQICVIVTALEPRNIRARCLTTDLPNVMKRTTHMYRSANIMKQTTAHAGSHLRIPDCNVLHDITFCRVQRSKATAVPLAFRCVSLTSLTSLASVPQLG